MGTLSNEAVRKELKQIMLRINYSWEAVSHKLQALLDSGNLAIEHYEAGNIIYK